jgi:hypothetical protein
MKDLDINKCVRRTSAPDSFKLAMAKGEVPIFGKKKSHLSKPKAKKEAAQ